MLSERGRIRPQDPRYLWFRLNGYIPVMNAMPVIETLRVYFESAPESLCASYLFGSVARGEPNPDSDIDVAILMNETADASTHELAERVEDDLDALLGVPVQVVVLNRAPVDLIHRVLRDGELLLDRNRARRIAFEVAARREYLDLRPVLLEYRRFPAAR
ncbi:nucleotidyltransferase domain-containing protein [soil metagenome]|jgi:predicted nucleotidyltransferase